MGERAQTGVLIYNVFDTKWMAQAGSGLNARVPANRFFLIRMSIVNSGSTETAAPRLTIADDYGQSYTELENGEGVPQWLGILRHLKPAENVTGNIVFDAPPRHYKLHISDESEEHKAIIDIPLTFAQDAPPDLPLPQVPAPPQPKQK
jgi:Domain of unknown function (DUF4352)